MRSIRFRENAEADLQGVIDWYEGVAPEALANVLADIFRSIDRLSRYPHSGMKVPRRRFRRIVTSRYRFKVVYEVSPDLIVTLGIYRYQNREH